MRSWCGKTLAVVFLSALSACGTTPIVCSYPPAPPSLMKPPVPLSSLTLKPSTNGKPSSATSTPSN
ncbi:hypothetical protein DIE19_28730 [Burkholderia sp. Bp9126]|nr:hypothetical protein DIE19_28730 [Burkholderia sp. Bp9126]